MTKYIVGGLAAGVALGYLSAAVIIKGYSMRYSRLFGFLSKG